ncbi:MAG: Ig-like domain-containing protein [Bacteroidaceae bacterium]|nr:Ig-like domain-containing protein [Bacteroidaceae bacterium]
MRVKELAMSLLLALALVACASIGTPDGGPYDEEPPVLLKATPVLNATGVKTAKISLEFDENVTLENAFENVVVSPPQMQMPEIKNSGKKVTVELFDSLKPNTTYSIDFGNAIVDNNESNPYENFAYVFSTGENVDTLAVSGTVLTAAELEPVKGMVVGLHSCLDDSAFTKTPFERVSRTDSRGRFTIKGIAPGKYRVYALSDANQNFLFDQKSEAIAYLPAIVEPHTAPAVRPDTIWRDSITIDTIRFVNYTRFMPDDLVLRVFKEDFASQYLIKYIRDPHNKLKLFFAAPNNELPLLEGLDFDISDAYILEKSAKMDTLTYWFKDSLLYRNDTLALRLSYKAVEVSGDSVDRCDTLFVSTKKRWEAVLKQQQKKYEEDVKNFMRQAKRSPDYDENNPPVYVPKTKVLPVRFSGSSSMDINGRCHFSFEEPLLSIDTSAIRVSLKVDTLWVPVDMVFLQDSTNIRKYDIFAEWRPEQTYMVTADSAAFKGLYGGVSEAFSREMTFKSLDEYAVLYVNVTGVGNNGILQLLDARENVVMEEKTVNGRCAFYFINPGTYYMRLIFDANGNGKWDTGNFEKGIQPENVSYYHHSLNLRAFFEYTQDDWDVSMPLNEQKPLEITKQKPDKERRKMNRNATRNFK